MATALIAVSVMAVCGIALGGVIGIAAKIFKVEIDPRIEEVADLLPGANCGGCGKAGCSDFAKAVVAGEVSPGGCPVCSGEAADKIAKLLGIDAGGGEKKVAVVFCGGDDKRAKNSVNYNGVNDCISASLIAGGPKDCRYGCLGLASCARACPFGAIEMLDGLAYVHEELCVACGKCIDACPRKLVKLVPLSAKVHVYCNSPEKGAAKKNNCEVSCIGCRKCVKAAEDGQVEINGFLAQINYENMPSGDFIEKAGCPTNCLQSPTVHNEKISAKEKVVR